LVDRRLTDVVIVVQDQNEWLIDAAQLIDQRGGQVIGRRRLERVQQLLRAVTGLGKDRLNGGDEIG